MEAIGLSRRLPVEWLENYVAAFEVGRVQKHPQARFVNERGECCIVGALAGVCSGEALTETVLWDRFLGSELEVLSRRFETSELSGQEFYEIALLEVMARRVAEAVAVVG